MIGWLSLAICPLLLLIIAQATVIGAEDIALLQSGVVKITSTPPGGSPKVGTGFIVRIDKESVYILTAAHVVSGDTRPQVEFFSKRNVLVPAEVLPGAEGADEVRGLAMLMVKDNANIPSGITALQLASNIRLTGGEDILLIGFPRGVGPWAIIRGNVSSRQGRDIYFSPTVSEGNSGGPIFHDGKVVGLVGAGRQSMGQGVTAGSIEDYIEGFGLTALGGTGHAKIEIATAQDDSKGHLTAMVTPHGGVDWTTGIATATGIGVPRKDSMSALQAKELTRTAAWTVALRNLMEVVHGLYLDSTTTVNNFVTLNADVRTKVEGVVREARVVKETELPTGEFETTVEMKLGGKFSDLLLPHPHSKTEPIKRLQRMVEPTPGVTKTPYTGLVIDARGTGAKPCLAPRVLTTQGEEVYGASYADQPQAGLEGDEKSRIAWYVTTEIAAKSHPRVAANPLMVKAARAEGPNRTDLVIQDAEAQLIQVLPENFALLKQAKVLVILDPM